MRAVRGFISWDLPSLSKGASSITRNQLSFPGKIFICRGKADFTTDDSNVDGSFSVEVVSPSLLAAEKEKSFALASLPHPSLDSKTCKAVSRVATSQAGKLPPHTLYLMKLGLEVEQIKGIIRRFPNFAYYSLEGKTKPAVEFLLHLGVPRLSIPTILTRWPQLCGCSISENILPTMASLDKLGVDQKQWANIIHHFPVILPYSRQKIVQTLYFLSEVGFSAVSTDKFIASCPNSVGFSVEGKVRPTAEYYRSLGVDISLLLYRSPKTCSLMTLLCLGW
ncbi:mTERF domain-containing protein [Cephalotus follicularis]|uniref:mTERF domain-containing protein n=1 Tax=Cephalotus follicularis TaxID=3775 RepID=A0A1Q3B944_CEPFO|nr:mTERF domain-containing protein [Cephalotus follicularis]